MSAFVPLYQRIKERIRADYLAARSTGRDARLPAERELQARYRVSRPTVSKALTALAAEGLLVKAQGRGTFAVQQDCLAPAPNPTAHRIGYVAPLAGAELVQRALRGIDRAAHRRGFSVIMGNAGNEPERERAAVRELLAAGARGLVVYPCPRVCDAPCTDYLEAEHFGVPVVLVDTAAPAQGQVRVVFANRRAAHVMTSWLMERGHRRIGLITYAERVRHPPLDDRLLGYRDALRDHGMDPDDRLVRRYDPAHEVAALSDLADAWLVGPGAPDAVIAPEDIAALELIEILMARGVRVPDDIRVVGFDNRDAARRFRPAFATTNPDFECMGEIAANLVLDGIRDGAIEPHTYVLDVPLLVRRAPETFPAAVVQRAAAR